MGRSVSYPTGSVVAFRLLDDGEDEDIDWVYECLVDEIIDIAKAAFPSLRALRWMARPRGSHPPAQRLRRLRHIDLLRACRDLARRARRSPGTGRPISTTHERQGHGTGSPRCREGSSTCLVSCAWSGGSRMAKRSSSAPDPLATPGPDPASSQSAGRGPWAGRGAPQPAARRPVLPAPA